MRRPLVGPGYLKLLRHRQRPGSAGHEPAESWLLGGRCSQAGWAPSLGLFIALPLQGGAPALSSHPGQAGVPPPVSQTAAATAVTDQCGPKGQEAALPAVPGPTRPHQG
jgi:hypothetical protein